MIGRLTGTLAHKQAPWVLMDVQGVGYDIQVPMSTFFQLPELGQLCTIKTHLVVREDAHLLYGFLTESERTLFRALIKVSGIGPKIGLAVLSSITPDEFVLAVQSQEPGRLVKIPGIGKKTAERMLLELKGQVLALGGDPAITASEAKAMSGQTDEIVQALVALGYSEKEASAACKGMEADVSVTDGIKQALKALSKG